MDAKPRSPFTVMLASMFHSGAFVEAAETIEGALLNGVEGLMNSKLPAPLAAAAQPLEQTANAAVQAATGDALTGQPVDTAQLAAALSSAVSKAVADAIGKALGH